MKYRLHLTPSTEPVPFNYMTRLVGVFHYWVGPNELHDKLSLYSLGWLHGGRMKVDKSGLEFAAGARWDIGIYNPEIADRMLKGIAMKPIVLYGMSVDRVEPLPEPDIRFPKTVFRCDSPILLRKGHEDAGRTHVTYDDPDASILLSKHLDRKLADAGMTMFAGQYALYFDPTYREAKTKLVRYKTYQYKTSECRVVCVGPPEVKRFLWTVGAGEQTGSGFGSLGFEPSVTRRNDPLRVHRVRKPGILPAEHQTKPEKS
jgi:CRISPR-associated endoribonuclease Cas6